LQEFVYLPGYKWTYNSSEEDKLQALNLIATQAPHLQILKIKGSGVLEEVHLAALFSSESDRPQWPQLEELDVADISATALPWVIRNCPSLKKWSLSGSRYAVQESEAFMKQLFVLVPPATESSLEWLSLSGITIPTEAFHAEKMPLGPDGSSLLRKLAYLDLSNASLEEGTLMELVSHPERLPGLTGLDLSFCGSAMTDAVAAQMAWPGLRQLKLTQCNFLTEDGWKSIADRCPQLETLEVPGLAKFSDEVVRYWCTRMEERSGLDGESRACGWVRLDVSSGGLSDEGLRALGESRVLRGTLRELDLGHLRYVTFRGLLQWAVGGGKSREGGPLPPWQLRRLGLDLPATTAGHFQSRERGGLSVFDSQEAAEKVVANLLQSVGWQLEELTLHSLEQDGLAQTLMAECPRLEKLAVAAGGGYEGPGLSSQILRMIQTQQKKPKHEQQEESQGGSGGTSMAWRTWSAGLVPVAVGYWLSQLVPGLSFVRT
jgi:hypothetical protein